MRLKVILSFLAIQIVSFCMWQGVNAWNKPQQIVVAPNEVLQHESAKTPEQPFSNVRFSAKSEDKKTGELSYDKKIEIISVLKKLPKEQISSLNNIVLDYDPNAWRGKGGKSIIIIRAVDMESEEFYGVMIHEIGHNVDLGYLSESSNKKASEFNDNKKPIYETDPSLSFYRISWNNERDKKKSAGNQDFVSGYAMQDPFEDFAESYVYFVLHNKDFKSKTQNSDKLLAKYNYMKNTVFGGKEFDTGEYLTEKNLTNQPWDITVLPYSLAGFLAG